MNRDRLHEALRWLASEFSCTPDEFRSEHKAGSDMLLQAMLSLGYARQENGRLAITATGRRRVEALEPSRVDEAEG
jgi:hypothetical protein